MSSREGSISPVETPDLPGLGTVNLSIGMQHDNGVSVSLFASNLLDERKKSLDFPHGAGSVLRVFNMNSPRTLGLRAGYQF